jgi:hypothetical protein
MKNYYPQFLRLHRNFLIRMLSLDIACGIVGGLFLIAPLHIFFLTLNNLVLLVLGVVAALLYQIHIYRTYGGNASFYLLLPVRRGNIFPAVICFSLLPLLVSVVVSACIKLVLGWETETGGMSYMQRINYLLIIFAIIKIIPLPIFVLYKMHLALVPAFFVMLAFVYLALSMVAEFVSGWFHMPGLVMAFLFAISVLVLCREILRRARIG